MSAAGLERISRAVADGAAVDWDVEIAAADTADEQALIASMRELSVIARGSDPPLSIGASLPSLTAPGVWGTFALRGELGRGAYGTVYRAHDQKLDRDVALKLLIADEHASDAGFIEEGRLLARLRHPNIVSVFGAETNDGQDGLWMELIDGRTYHQIVTTDGPLGFREAALVGVDLCRALAAVHRAGLFHRDVTARNLMRETGGRVVLLDFSAGRRWSLEEGTFRLAGTPLYLPPEAFLAGAGASVASDIYSAGVLLFFLVTGMYPLTAASVPDLRAAHAAGTRQHLQHARADLPAAFIDVVERALDADPMRRFDSAVEMAKALLAASGTGYRLDEPPASPSSGSRPTAMSRPIPAWAAVVLALVAAGLTGWLAQRPPPGSPPASTVAAGLTSERWSVLSGYLDLADEAGDRGVWNEAATLYERAAELLRTAVGEDEPFRAVVLSERAWALSSAKRYGEAHAFHDLALYKLVQEAGPAHPLGTTMELARAATFGAEGRSSEAMAAVARAAATHRASLAAVGIIAAAPAPVLDSAGSDICADHDGDWLLDVLERGAGLNPERADSDNDGIRDDEEDADGDRVPNGVAWPYGCDPRRVLAHHGNLDPLRLGFRKERQFEARAVESAGLGRAWQVNSPMGFYYARLTNAQKRAAMARGWRLRSLLAFHDGAAFASLDLTPHARRFDQWFFGRGAGEAAFYLASDLMPRAGEWLEPKAPGPMALVEYVFDATAASARVLVNGRTLRASYTGQPRYQEDFGLFFGTNNDMGAARQGLADFALTWLAIR